MTRKAKAAPPGAGAEPVGVPVPQDVYDAWRDAKGKHRRPVDQIGDAELAALLGDG